MTGSMASVTALLPMKANSERVKAKNFRMIAGKPLFRWVLDEMLAVDAIKQVVINTDARELLREAGLEDGAFGGRVIIRDRPEEICGDMVSMNRVIENDIQNVPSDLYLMTHTTNPLLKAATIQAMLDAYANNQDGADSLFTVNKHQTRFYTPAGEAINHDPANLVRTQDLDPYFEENSVCYLFTRESFEKTDARIGEKPILFETPPLESVDIDEPSDWVMAEALLERLAGDAPVSKLELS